MKRFFLFLTFLLIGYISFSQNNILVKKSKIKQRLEKYFADNNRTYTKTETDSTLAYTLSDSLTLPATYVCYFNKLDRCQKEETIFSCDSCLQNGMKSSLEKKFINWKKIGLDIYYAGFPYNVLMDKNTAGGQFVLRFTRMKKKEASLFTDVIN